MQETGERRPATLLKALVGQMRWRMAAQPEGSQSGDRRLISLLSIWERGRVC